MTFFFRGRLDGWVMQRLGTFSVDREGTDRQAMDQAARTLARGKFPLTLFPEGNVYLENDRVTPFHDGAAFLATRAAKQLAERGKRLVVVPVSIKATHLTDPQGALVEAIRRMARTLDVKLTPEQTALSALWAIGQAGVRRNLKHRGIDLSPLEGRGGFQHIHSLGGGRAVGAVGSEAGADGRSPVMMRWRGCVRRGG